MFHMKKLQPFRYWFYFRQGWAIYFSLIMGALNTLTVTYYLIIKDYPFLKDLFPSFIYYVLITIVIGFPLLTIVGFIHYRRTQAYHAEAEVNTENNPYNYRLPPGYWKEAIVPNFILLTHLMTKMLRNEKLTDDELKQIDVQQKKLDELLKGGSLGK